MDAGENWTLADKYIKFACSIEAFEEKITSILFKYEYEDTIKMFF